ncbi:MAG: tripartite tricarboxylate transporter substrate binding protein, partial [Burkholderiales bacterium]|nr:tripartite tricarboxylate transporter substrate binding protein [Burkholderiales bacterium]
MKKVFFKLLPIAVLIFSGFAYGQNYPEKPLRIIVPYVAGGATDIYARVLAKNMTDALGQTVIVDNRPGAATIIGTQVAAKSPNDGYTLLLGVVATFASNPHLYKNLPYAFEDFSPITMVGESAGWSLMVHPSLPAKTVEQLISVSRSRPEQIAMGTFGIGSGPYVVLKSFERLAKLNMVEVSYKGAAEVRRDLLAGHIMLSGDGIAGAIPLHQMQKLRILAISGSKRVNQLPDVPTLVESGFPQLLLVNRFSMLAPKGTNEKVIGKLNEAVVLAMSK